MILIRVVVENGTAVLFRGAEKLRSRMKSFLSSADEFDKAALVDLMKYLLSYANICPGGVYHSNDKIVEAAVRNLLNELAMFSYDARKLDSRDSIRNHCSDGYGQAPRPQWQQVKMKPDALL